MQQILAAGVDWMRELQMLFGQLLGWLKEWQALVASLIVVIAGLIAVNAINGQIRGQSFEVEKGRRRSVRAFRASMPEDLYAICAYARRSAELGREGVQRITAEEEEPQSPKKRQNRVSCPLLPTSVLANLKALIENLDDSRGEQVADLVRSYHSQHNRLAEALENCYRSSPSTISVSSTTNFNPVFKDTLELYLRARGMLQFARGESENIADAFDSSEVLTALEELKIDNVISPEGREFCLRFLSKEKELGRSRLLSRRGKARSKLGQGRLERAH